MSNPRFANPNGLQGLLKQAAVFYVVWVFMLDTMQGVSMQCIAV